MSIKGSLKVSDYLDKAGEPRPSIDMVADGLLALDKPCGGGNKKTDINLIGAKYVS